MADRLVAFTNARCGGQAAALADMIVRRAFFVAGRTAVRAGKGVGGRVRDRGHTRLAREEGARRVSEVFHAASASTGLGSVSR
jgi:hypothetical protein